MPIKLLTVAEQVDLLSKLNKEEKEFDRNLSLIKGDLYTLKHKHNIDLEPSPIETIKETIRQQPTISAIKNIPKLEIKKEPRTPEPLVEPKLEPLEPELTEPGLNDELSNGIDLAVIEKHGFPIPEMISSNKLDVSELSENIGYYIKTKIAPILGKLSRGHKKHTDEYAKIKKEQEMLSQYKAKLEAWEQEFSPQEGGKLVIYFTSLADLQKRFLELLGEIKAGNNNYILKNELVGIADILLHKGKLSKSEYKQIFQFLEI